VRYARAHPHQPEPGEPQFREANRLIIANTNDNQVFGNSAAARALAQEYSKSLKILRDNLFTKDNPTAIGSMEGDFHTFCQLNDDSCVFLVHVPELRRFDDEAKKSLTDFAWINAQSVLKASTRKPPKSVVVGVKGLMLYDAILIGDYVADPEPGKDGIQTRSAGLQDMKLFYPYFAPPMTSTNLPESSESEPRLHAVDTDVKVKSAVFGVGSHTADVTAQVIELLRSHPDGFKVNAERWAWIRCRGKRNI
jgi:hypothetical protein